MKELCQLCGIKQKSSSSYHPQTDRNTEILNQYIDQRLRPFVNHNRDNWAELLPALDYAQATLLHDSTGLSPFELKFGYAPRDPWDWERRPQSGASARENLNRLEAQKLARQSPNAIEWAKKT